MFLILACCRKESITTKIIISLALQRVLCHLDICLDITDKSIYHRDNKSATCKHTHSYKQLTERRVVLLWANISCHDDSNRLIIEIRLEFMENMNLLKEKPISFPTLHDTDHNLQQISFHCCNKGSNPNS